LNNGSSGAHAYLPTYLPTWCLYGGNAAVAISVVSVASDATRSPGERTNLSCPVANAAGSTHRTWRYFDVLTASSTVARLDSTRESHSICNIAQVELKTTLYSKRNVEKL